MCPVTYIVNITQSFLLPTFPRLARRSFSGGGICKNTLQIRFKKFFGVLEIFLCILFRLRNIRKNLIQNFHNTVLFRERREGDFYIFNLSFAYRIKYGTFVSNNLTLK